jgi:MFS family permease
LSPPIPDPLSAEAPRERWRVLALLAVAELLGMSLWFSASASVPAIQAEWRLADSTAAWLTLAIQLGFVWGTLVSALSNLPDVVNTRRLFAASALLAALSNAAFGLFAKTPTLGIPLRFATGFFLAGVYPPGMKIMATWFRRGRGMALGVLVGAVTLGKASPYLVNALGTGGWRGHVLFVSLLAVFGGTLVLFFVSDGPYSTGNAPFDIRQVGEVYRNRGVRLANFGYFGHMWELYAMWTWAPVFIRASFAASGSSPVLAEAGSFLVLGAGAAGCVAAGVLGDRIGRTVVASSALAISGACCLIVGFLYGAAPGLLLSVMAIWGAAVVADSAQFSACVSELGDPRYLGTALTVQICLGFLLTTVSIRMMPGLVRAVTWRYAFAFLAAGPVFGVISMLRLRGLPEAVKIAQGRR